jgi:DNA invertase Pin-like site-specific DNA recombinase
MSLSKQRSASIGPIEKTINDVAAESVVLPSPHDLHAMRGTGERGSRADDGSQGTRTPTPGARNSEPAFEPPSGSTQSGRPLAPMQDDSRQEPAMAGHTAVVGYASVDVSHPGDPNTDLQRQAREITSECLRRGLALVQVLHDRVSPRQHSLDRPGLGHALETISAKQAGGLVVTELSSLSRALPDLGRVLEWLMDRDIRVIAVASRIDTAEQAGRLAIRTIVEVSHWERQRLAERTRAGMRAARRKGPASVTDDPRLKDRIAAMRAAGMTLQAIANQLNADGIPTLRGGVMWRPSSVQTAVGYHRPVTGRAVDRPPNRLPTFKTDEPGRGA